MSDGVEVLFNVLYASGEICNYCGKRIEDLKVIVTTLPSDQIFFFHEGCLERLGWNFTHFVFNYKVDQDIPAGVH